MRAAVRRASLRGFVLRLREVATAPRTTAPVAATMAAIGPPARAAVATMPTVLFAPVRASGTTGQPPGVCSTPFSAGACSTGAGASGGGGAGAGMATGSVLSSVML